MDTIKLQGIPKTKLRLSRPKFINWANSLAEKGDITLADAARMCVARDEYIEEQRRHKIATTCRASSWDSLIRPLVREMRTTESSLYHQRKLGYKRNEALIELLEAYEAVLTRVREEIHQVMKGGRVGMVIMARIPTVQKYNEDRIARGKKPIPHDGEHWVDWVPRMVLDSFQPLIEEAMTHRRKGDRFKRYFERPVTDKQREAEKAEALKANNALKRERLHKTIERVTNQTLGRESPPEQPLGDWLEKF